MDIASAVRNLATEFNALLDAVQETVAATARHEREASLRSMEAAQAPGGVLAVAEQTRDELARTVADYRRFEQLLAQMEQIYLISEDLKQVVRDLRANSN